MVDAVEIAFADNPGELAMLIHDRYVVDVVGLKNVPDFFQGISGFYDKQFPRHEFGDRYFQ